MSFALYNCRNMIFSNYRRLSTTTLTKNNIRGFINKFQECKSHTVLPSRTWSIPRCFSTQTNSDSDDKPAYNPLMDFPVVCWPGLFRMVKCWIMFKLILPSLDNDFKLDEFIEGSQQAACFVSNALSKEDYESLEGLVTPEAIEVLKKNVSKLSDEQKRQICLEKKEAFFCFPGEISVRNGTEESTRIVEILLIFHFLRDWKDPQAASSMVQSEYAFQKLDIINEIVSNPDYPSHAIVCNYQFIRKFGSSDKSWSINVLNQFRMCDLK